MGLKTRLPSKLCILFTENWSNSITVLSCLTLYCSRFFSLLVSVSSRSLWMAAICLFLSLMAWSRDFSSFLIHLSRSSLEVNWLPRPCLAYRSVLSCVAWASLEGGVTTNHKFTQETTSMGHLNSQQVQLTTLSATVLSFSTHVPVALIIHSHVIQRLLNMMSLLSSDR